MLIVICRVVYLSPADNSAGPVWSRPRDVNQTVLTSHRIPKTWSKPFALLVGPNLAKGDFLAK